MTATKAWERHAAGAKFRRVRFRRPKAANDRRRAKRALEAAPPNPPPALEPEGPEMGGALEAPAGVDPDGEASGEPATDAGVKTLGAIADGLVSGPARADP
jgi:hypothetical protein